jgi:hypothetical protein
MSRHEYSPELQCALSQLGWHGRLNEAVSEEDVVAIARDYMALWSPEELGELPADLRPGKLVDGDDVNGFALALVQAQMARGTRYEAHVHKMGAFFSNASLRIAQILARMSEVSSEGAESASRYGR